MCFLLTCTCVSADLNQQVRALWYSRGKEWAHWQRIHHIQEHCGCQEVHRDCAWGDVGRSVISILCSANKSHTSVKVYDFDAIIAALLPECSVPSLAKFQLFCAGKSMKACYGTTKYCNAFLKGLPCNNVECLYLHDVGEASTGMLLMMRHHAGSTTILTDGHILQAT